MPKLFAYIVNRSRITLVNILESRFDALANVDSVHDLAGHNRPMSLARILFVSQTTQGWASLRYNPWAKGVYDRIYGNQKTRKKKAAIALARKIAVLAWAMLRDEKDWDPGTMIRITKSYGGKLPIGEEVLNAMKPKECRHKRKRRLAKEAATKAAEPQEASKPKTVRTKISNPSSSTAKTLRTRVPKTSPTSGKKAVNQQTPLASKPRRARKLVSGG
ncbi:MAG: hypothetical protein SGI77_26305 [Pirellulaceae bacterium]|nr:hypothetical protein [Pirellulaceae bacterium]